MFQLGDKVTWTSSAAGNTRTKLGEVIEVVPARAHPSAKVDGSGGWRNHVSYIVRAIAQGTETSTRRLYWPRVAALSLAEPQP